MTTLAESLEALRRHMIEATEDELRDVEALGGRMHDADAALMRALERLVADQESRRRDITAMIGTLAARIGHLPPLRVAVPPAQPAAPALGQGEAQAMVPGEPDRFAAFRRALAPDANLHEPDYTNGTLGD